MQMSDFIVKREGLHVSAEALTPYYAKVYTLNDKETGRRMASPLKIEPRASAKHIPSNAMRKTYSRMQLYALLQQPRLLKAVEIHGQHVRFITESWSEYWGEAPLPLKQSLTMLEEAWRQYIGSGFSPSYLGAYCDAYFALLAASNPLTGPPPQQDTPFIHKIIGFESYSLQRQAAPAPFAAATASFRNPAFLSFQRLGIRKHARDDPNLLALIAVPSGKKSAVFYHYRKQRLLKNSEDSILYFPAVDLEARPKSFQGLDALTDSLVEQWDSRIEQRARLIGNKVLIPFLAQCVASSGITSNKPIRVLDIGSGVGLFTSKLLAKVASSGVLGAQKIELSLLDMLHTDPTKRFTQSRLLPCFTKVEYIRSDYQAYLASASLTERPPYDIIFFFRILHNLSTFCVEAKPQSDNEAEVRRRRYPFAPHMSDYYRAIATVLQHPGKSAESTPEKAAVWRPQRIFNPSSLVAPDGSDLLDLLCRIAKAVLIEDGDFDVSALLRHVVRYNTQSIQVFDLSKALRLATNHVYWITASDVSPPIPGEKIWPN